MARYLAAQAADGPFLCFTSREAVKSVACGRVLPGIAMIRLVDVHILAPHGWSVADASKGLVTISVLTTALVDVAIQLAFRTLHDVHQRRSAKQHMRVMSDRYLTVAKIACAT